MQARDKPLNGRGGNRSKMYTIPPEKGQEQEQDHNQHLLWPSTSAGFNSFSPHCQLPVQPHPCRSPKLRWTSCVPNADLKSLPGSQIPTYNPPDLKTPFLSGGKIASNPTKEKEESSGQRRKRKWKGDEPTCCDAKRRNIAPTLQEQQCAESTKAQLDGTISGVPLMVDVRAVQKTCDVERTVTFEPTGRGTFIRRVKTVRRIRTTHSVLEYLVIPVKNTSSDDLTGNDHIPEVVERSARQQYV